MNGGKLFVTPPIAVEDALKLGAPFWAGPQAREAFRSLRACIVHENARSTMAEPIIWRATDSIRISNWPARDVWQLRPWADPEGDQRWIDFARSCATQREPDKREELSARLSGKKATRTVLVGPGPSLRSLRPAKPDEITIFTLSAQLNLPPSADIIPDILIFADALSTIGPSSVAQANRDVLAKAADQGALLVTTASIARILADQLPLRARSQILGFAVSQDPVLAASQSIAEGPLPNTNNVLTMLGLPIASGLSPQITMIGFDGVAREGATFDHHNNYEQLRRISLLRAAHPSIGRRDNYYDNHRHHTAVMMDRLDAHGVHFTPSLSEMNLPRGSAASFKVQRDSSAQRIYDVLDKIDRSSPERFVLFATLGIMMYVGALLFVLRSITLENLIASFILSWLVVTIGVFIVRRRQNRQMERLRHDVMVNVQEMNQIIVQRLERLEQSSTRSANEE